MRKARKISKQTCLVCDSVFESRSNRGNYMCSDECRMARRQEIYKRNMLDHEWRLKKLCAMAKNRAKVKSLAFDLDVEYLLGLWEDLDGHCCLSGIEFDLEVSGIGQVKPHAPSVDRIVPEKGYVKGNVRLVCYQMNVALSEFGLEQFNNLVDLYVKYNRGVSI